MVEHELKKKCSCCKKNQPISSFNSDITRPDKHAYRCKTCSNKDNERYRKEHVEEIKIYKKEYIKLNPKKKWVTTTISHHRHKGYIVNITQEELENRIEGHQRCEICGCELRFEYGNKHGHVHCDSPSLDRKNNEQELNMNNIMILCNQCNRTKGERRLDEFIEYCKMVTQNDKLCITKHIDNEY